MSFIKLLQWEVIKSSGYPNKLFHTCASDRFIFLEEKLYVILQILHNWTLRICHFSSSVILKNIALVDSCSFLVIPKQLYWIFSIWKF